MCISTCLVYPITCESGPSKTQPKPPPGHALKGNKIAEGEETQGSVWQVILVKDKVSAGVQPPVTVSNPHDLFID